MNYIEKLDKKRKEHIMRQIKYNKSDKGKLKTRLNSKKYYYRNNNIYHPELNKEGTIERKFKKIYF